MIKKLIMMMMFISSVVFSTVFSEDKCEPHEPFDKKAIDNSMNMKDTTFVTKYLGDICFEGILYRIYVYYVEDHIDYYLVFIDKDLNWIQFWYESVLYKSYKDEVIYSEYHEHTTTKWYIRLQLEQFRYQEKYHDDIFTYYLEQMWGYNGHDYKESVCSFQDEPIIKYNNGRAINCEASVKKPKK